MFDIIAEIAKRVELTKNDGDYSIDGILHCGVCKEPKQGIFDIPERDNPIIAAISCRCEREAEEAEKRKLDQYNQQLYQAELKKGVTAAAFQECTFDKDDNRQPEISDMCKKYVNHFSDLQTEGYGILFYGDVGKGKSFYAACIANALISDGVPVLFSTLSNLVQNRISAMHGEKERINLADYALIVIDDLGTENATPTAFSIIDEAYGAKKPIIITTNLSPKQLSQNTDMDKKRIYDRIIEMCPLRLFINNEQSRLKQGNDRKKKMLDILNL